MSPARFTGGNSIMPSGPEPIPARRLPPLHPEQGRLSGGGKPELWFW